MDKFAENAFKDAMEKQADDEFKSWCKFSEKESTVVNIAVAAKIGIEKMNALCGAVIDAGQGHTLAEYAHYLMMMAFHRGYKARMEEGAE